MQEVWRLSCLLTSAEAGAGGRWGGVQFRQDLSEGSHGVWVCACEDSDWPRLSSTEQSSSNPHPPPPRCSSGDLDLRLGFDLCDGEKEFLDKRKQIVSKALQQVLGLSQAPTSDQVWKEGGPSVTRTKSNLFP